MSFSADAKCEVARFVPTDEKSALAECFGILLFSNLFQSDCIKIVTESSEFAKILPKLFRKAFGVGFDVLPQETSQGKLTFQIRNTAKIETIMNCFGFSASDTVSLHINLPIVEEDEWKVSFFRGAFLAGGSVTDPAKGYHCELSTTHQIVARECEALFYEALGFPPKTAKRSGGQILYLKQSDCISDFLTYLGAPVAAMSIMETKLERELNNKVNRCCNCDEANTSKTVEAAQEQLVAIRTIRRHMDVETLGDKLVQAIIARENNPEASLAELAALMNPPITKAAMNHRLKRLIVIAKELK